MGKLNKDESGFSPVELVIIVLIVALLGGAGWYMWQKNQTKKDSTKTTTTSKNSTTTPATATKQTPEGTLGLLSSAMKAKDKAKFDALTSDEMKANASTEGNGSPYDNFAATVFFAAVFTDIDFSKHKPVVSDYTSPKGVKGGKQLTYTIVSESDGAKSTNVYKFNFVPNGDKWLFDDMSIDSLGEADISTE